LRDIRDIYSKQDKKKEGGRYSETALDHFLNPRNVGVIEDADAYARVGDPSCGDFMELFLTLDSKREMITGASFRVFGCAGAIATASIATELITGKDFIYGLSLTDDDVIEALGGIPEGKRHCSLLIVTAVRAALSEYIMKEYAISEGLARDEAEFREKFLVRNTTCVCDGRDAEEDKTDRNRKR
jgi:nitrogen fixation NifU-like protein